jgi:hypothetical protein
MATSVKIRQSGLLPYTFAKGVIKRGETPEKRMKTVVEYDASSTVTWRFFATRTKDGFRIAAPSW